MKILENKQYYPSYNKGFDVVKSIFTKYQSVIYCDYIEQSSSSGAWTGYILQKISNSRAYIILFSQELQLDGDFILKTYNKVVDVILPISKKIVRN